MKAKRKRRMSRRRRELTYIAVMVLLAIAVSIGLTRSVMQDDKEFEEYEQQSQEFNTRMQRIDEKREASGQNAMLEQVRTWQQDTEPDKYAVFDTMSADWGGEEDGFVLYEIPEEYSRTGGYFPEKMQVYTYCVCKQYGVRYDLVVALIEKESGYKFDKVGDDGHSIGYMQIYEECHRDRMERLNVTDLTNPLKKRGGSRTMSGFCRWYEKDMEDITEHEQEQCEENGQDCRECPDLMIKEQEAAGHERHNTDS